MTPAVDPTVRLALALSSSRGAYAALLGSGLSAAAGIPTGRQIVADLIAKVAALEGTELGDDPFAWYRGRFGEEPDYSTLLDELATSPTQRSELLRGYFEPTDEQRRQGLRVPGASHHALAQLAARGYITVFLTTNFDRLLEHALERAGVEPTTLGTPDSLEGTGALARNRCTVIKVNGDYLDTRIKNTPAELDFYHPAVERLLDRVLDEYGLIVCGWSADWDTALRRAFERATTHRYATFWAARRPPTGEAARLFTLRRAELVTIKDADTLFTDLVAKLAALDKEPPGTAGRMSTPVAAHLPARTAAFIGRRTELSEIGERLKDPAARLLTLLGTGGTGKTTVAIEAANAALPDFPDGVIFVDLSRARDTNAVLTAITRAIGLGEEVERPPKEVLADHMRERRLLLVLDNFEQVTAAAATCRGAACRVPFGSHPGHQSRDPAPAGRAHLPHSAVGAPTGGRAEGFRRGGASLRSHPVLPRPREGGPARLRADRRECAGRCGDLPPARRLAFGDRARCGAFAPPVTGSVAAPAGGQAEGPPLRAARSARAAAGAARHHGLEL